MLEPGDPAPDVSAPNQDGETVSLDFREPTVVYFYPKDFTGGCTLETNEFQDAHSEYRDSGISVYGISMDDVDTHADFADEEGVEFDLLADPDGEVADAFGVDTSDGFTDRLTFVLGDDEVLETYDPELAEPTGHAREVLEDTREQHVPSA